MPANINARVSPITKSRVIIAVCTASRTKKMGRPNSSSCFARINLAGAEGLGALDERSDDLPEFRGARRADHGRLAAAKVRDGEPEHGLGLHVGDLPKLHHQLRDLDESGEAGIQAVAGAVRREFHGRDGFAEGGRPGIEMVHVEGLEDAHLEIAAFGPAAWGVGPERTGGLFLEMAYGRGFVLRVGRIAGHVGVSATGVLALGHLCARVAFRGRKNAAKTQVMDQNSMTRGEPEREGGQRARTAFELIRALSDERHRQLESLAKALMERAGVTEQARRYLAQTSPLELLDEVFYKVLRGDRDRKLGRQLKRRDRASTDAFIARLRGFIADEVKTRAGRAEAAIPHLPIGDEAEEPGMIDPPDPTDPIRLLEHRDLKRAILAELWRAAKREKRLLPVIQRWEESFLADDRVPLTEAGHKPTHRARTLTRRFLQRLAREQEFGQDGREML